MGLARVLVSHSLKTMGSPRRGQGSKGDKKSDLHFVKVALESSEKELKVG